MEQTAKSLLDVHFPDDNPDDYIPEQTRIRLDNRNLPTTPGTVPSTCKEVQSAIKKFVDNKAPEPDLIEVVALKMRSA